MTKPIKCEKPPSVTFQNLLEYISNKSNSSIIIAFSFELEDVP